MLAETDQRILDAMLADARISLKELAQRVGLSPPSVSERLRRLEERGVIRAYTVELNPQALGYPLQAIVRVRPLPGKLQTVEKLLAQTPEVCECDKITGDDCFVVRMFVRSIEQLDQLLDRITDKAETNTAIVKRQVVARRAPPVAYVVAR
jgi:Lrp/AsnC family leucine-responsive transcriptional regulator